MASFIRISKAQRKCWGARISKLKNLPWAIPGVVPERRALSNDLMLKTNCRQRGYPIRPDPNLGPEYQEGTA